MGVRTILPGSSSPLLGGWSDVAWTDSHTSAQSMCDKYPYCPGYTCTIKKCWVFFPYSSRVRYEDNDDYVTYVKETYDKTVWSKKYVGKTFKTNPQLGSFSNIR